VSSFTGDASTVLLIQNSKGSITTANPFTNLSNVVSGLTTIGHLDVYSLSRESLQRMLPASKEPSSATSGPSAPRPPPDTRQFQYRFSMTYIRSLPEGQRPVEREVFGESAVHAAFETKLMLRSFPNTNIGAVESFRRLRPKLSKYRDTPSG
jgi:hypothetical protein